MPSSKGPAVVRYSMLMREQESYNYNFGNGNYFVAALKLQGILELLPPEYNIKVPDIPDEMLVLVTKPSVDQERKIRKWAVDTQKSAYAGISRFIKEEYSNLQGDI